MNLKGFSFQLSVFRKPSSCLGVESAYRVGSSNFQVSGFSSQVFSRGFSLVEVTLALGVAIFCLTTIFGLLPVGIRSNLASVDQTVASGVVSAITADLRATPVPSGKSSFYGIVTSGPATQQLRLCADGTIDKSAGGANSIYLAYVTISATTTTPSATPVRILITWPAAADLNNNPPKNFVGSYEAVTTLDRY